MAAQMLCGRLYVFDGSADSPVFPATDLRMTQEELDYCLNLKKKTEGADTTRETRFLAGSETASLFDSYAEGEEGAFLDAFAAQYRARLQTAELPQEGFDLVAYFCAEEDGTLWFAAFSLPYQTSLFHRVSGGTQTALEPRSALPFPGGRTVAGVLVSFATCAVYLRDQSLRTQQGTKSLLGDIVLDCEPSVSEAETVKAVQKIALSVAEDDRAPWEAAEDPKKAHEEVRRERKQQVQQALSRSVSQTGALDMEYIAEEMFPGNEPVKEKFQERLRSEGLADVVEIESDRLRSALEKVRFSTDTGIQITLPRQIADDMQRFEIVNHPDGSISIEIKNIQSVRRG